jgi:putative membrane protein
VILPSDVPLTPDSDQAQTWITEELARPEYGSELSPLTRAIRSLLELFLRGFGSGEETIPVEGIILGIFLLFLIFLGVVVLLNPVRMRRAAQRAQVFDDDSLTAEDVRRAMAEAEKSAQWDMATVWAFRLIVMELTKADILRDSPGLTAGEASERAGSRFPQLKDDFARARSSFAAIRYGDAPGTRSDYAAMRSLEGALAQALSQGAM